MIIGHVQAALPPGLPGFEPELLLTPPQLFTKQDVPLDYGFRSYYGSDPDHFKTGAPNIYRAALMCFKERTDSSPCTCALV